MPFHTIRSVKMTFVTIFDVCADTETIPFCDQSYSCMSIGVVSFEIQV